MNGKLKVDDTVANRIVPLELMLFIAGNDALYSCEFTLNVPNSKASAVKNRLVIYVGASSSMLVIQVDSLNFSAFCFGR